MSSVMKDFGVGTWGPARYRAKCFSHSHTAERADRGRMTQLLGVHLAFLFL